MRRRTFLKMSCSLGAGLALSGIGLDLKTVKAHAMDMKRVDAMKQARQSVTTCPYCAVGCGLICSTDVKADKKTLTAFPASKSLIGSWLDFLPHERKNTSTMHKIAPTKAPKGIQTPRPEPIVAPKAAPAVTPSIEESAKGLLKNP